MPLYDYCCSSCGRYHEAFLAYPPLEAIHSPCCGGPASRIWIKAPGIAGMEGGRFPYYDQQLGKTVHSIAEREQIAKARGLVIMGRDEFNHTLGTHHEPVETYIQPEPWREAAAQAWQDIQSQAVPLERHATVEEKQAQMGTDITMVSE